MISKDYQKGIILGSTSFAGAWFVHEALNQNIKITGISRSEEPDDIFLPYKANENLNNFQYHQLDINADNDKVIELILKEEPDFIIDFAGQGMVAPSWQWPEQWYQSNLVSKVKIHNAIKDKSFLKKYIRVSTPEVYGHTDGLIKEHTNYNPSTPYAVSHAAIDMHLAALHKQYNFPVILTRFANFYGSSQQLYRITPKALYCAMTSETLPLHGGGKSIRSFIHAKDVSNGLLLTLAKGNLGDIYHFSTEEFVSIRELVEHIADIVGVTSDQFVKVTEDRPAKDPAYFMDFSKAKSELGWQPEFNLTNGLKESFDWVESNLDHIKTLPKDYIHKP